MSFEEDDLNLSHNQINIQNNSSFFKDFKEDEFSDVSSIDNLENIQILEKNEIQQSENFDEMEKLIQNNFNIELEDINPIIDIVDNIIDEDLHSIKNIIKMYKKKRTKEDLNKTPLPIFDCIYCSNEKVVFDHMIKEYLSDKYLLNTSLMDMERINNILNNEITKFDKNTQNLVNFIIYHTEYITKFNKSENIKKILPSLIKKNSQNKFVPTIKYRYNNCWNTLTLTLTFLKNKTTNANLNKIGSKSNDVKFSSKTPVEISPNISNFYYSNSINLQKNELNNIENIENNESFLKFLKFDLTRKIRKEDIIYENEFQDIWNPHFSSDDEDEIVTNLNNHKYDELKNKSYKVNLNSEDNLSLQFSNNNSTINNLFDTNSNINIKSNFVDKDDKSLNNNLINNSNNLSTTNFNQFRTYNNSNNFEYLNHNNNSISLNNTTNNSLIKIKQTCKEVNETIPQLKNIKTDFDKKTKLNFKNNLSFPENYNFKSLSNINNTCNDNYKNVKLFTKFSDFKNKYLNSNLNKSKYNSNNSLNNLSTSHQLLQSTKNSSQLLTSSFMNKSISNNEILKSFTNLKNYINNIKENSIIIEDEKEKQNNNRNSLPIFKNKILYDLNKINTKYQPLVTNYNYRKLQNINNYEKEKIIFERENKNDPNNLNKANSRNKNIKKMNDFIQLYL